MGSLDLLLALLGDGCADLSVTHGVFHDQVLGVCGCSKIHTCASCVLAAS